MRGFRPRYPHLFFCVLLLWITWIFDGRAQESLADLESFREGCQALADQRFETAAREFRKTWDLLKAEEAGDVEKNFVAKRLVESLVRNGNTSGAVKWSRRHTDFFLDPQTTRWVALAFQNERLFAEAAELYNSLASGDSLSRNARMDHAVCLAASGQEALAYETILKCEEPVTAAESVLFGQVAARAGKTEEANAYLDSIDPADLTTEDGALAFRIRLWIALQSGKREEAIQSLFEEIDRAGDSGQARKLFLILESLAQEAPIDGLAKHLQPLTSKPDHPASEAASLFSIILTNPEEEQLPGLTRFLKSNPSSNLALEAKLRIQNLEADSLKLDIPLEKSLPQDLENRARFSQSVSLYMSDRFEEAAQSFQQAAESEKGNIRATNLYNAAVASLRAEDIAKFSSLRSELSGFAPRSPVLADLDYLGGLYYASRGDAKAFDMLTGFVRSHPNHPSHVDAQLALAEIQLNQAPARPLAAREIVDQLSNQPLTLLQSERLDYIAIWTEIADNKSAEVIRLSQSFLNDWPSSSYLAEIALLLAGKLYVQKNNAAAKKYFDFVAEKFPSSPSAGTAKFFAAKSSPPEENTVLLWKSLIQDDGEFALQAKHELGLLLLSLDRFEEARNEFTSLIEDEDCPPGLRFAVTADLGFSWYAQALADDRNRENLEKAASIYADLSRTQEASRFWRYSAAVRRAKCLEALGNSPVALEIYRSIVEEAESPHTFLESELSRAEADWVYRAGFAAIQILSTAEDWKGAIKLADSLSQKDGPRAIEAARLAEKLRLKHWVWE